ncbi:MAG: hypothetical protein MH137_00025 [Flavobacteriales bacterium]|nr:hypothetical protein [Flavobacteriales bacterium]
MTKSLKSIITGVIGVLFSTFCFAQTSVKWGNEVKLKGGDFYSGIISEMDSSLYLLKLRTEVFFNDGFYLDKFDAGTLNFKNTYPILLRNARIESEGRELVPSFEKAMMINGELAVFLTAYDKASDNNIAFVATFDKNHFQTGLIELDRIVNAKRYNTGGFEFVLSPDAQKLMIIRKRPFQKKENARLDFKILDSRFELIHSKSVLLPYKEKNFEIKRHALDNQGNVVLLARIEKENKEFLIADPGHYFSLIEFSPEDTSGVFEYELSSENRILADLDFILSNNDEILIPGFYTLPGKEGVQGTFFMSIDRREHKVKSSAVKSFEKSLLLDFINERKYNKGMGLPGFNINYTIPISTGGLYVVSEQYYMSEVCGRDGRGFLNCNYYYYYNSLVVFRISESGEILWNTVVPKYQFSINDEGFYSSFSLAVTGDRLHFIYNDHPKNIQIQKMAEYKIMTRPSTSQAIHVTVNPDGTFIKEPLFSNKDEKLILRPKFSGQVKEGEMIISAVPKNNYVKLGTLTFDSPR